MTAVVCAFVLGLAVLFPWLAYVEEQRFRVGLERVGLVVAALLAELALT